MRTESQIRPLKSEILTGMNFLTGNFRGTQAGNRDRFLEKVVLLDVARVGV